jgi:hypothetical protein
MMRTHHIPNTVRRDRPFVVERVLSRTSLPGMRAVIDLGDVRRHKGFEVVGPSNAKDLRSRPAKNGDDGPALC